MSDALVDEWADDDTTMDLPDHTREKRLAVAGLLVNAALAAVLPLIMSEILSFVIPQILCSALVFTWIYFDALELGDPIGGGTKVSLFLFGVIAIPIYFYRSRGVKYGTLALARAVGLFLLMMVIASSLEFWSWFFNLVRLLLA